MAEAVTQDLELDGRRRRGRLRREQIIGAATVLFNERTSLGVSMEEIGEAAGVTGPAVYRHFRSKEQLLAEVLRPVVEIVWSAVPAAASRDPLGALDEFLGRVARLAVDRPDLIRLWYQEWRNLPDDDRRAARDLMRQTADRLARLLRRARPELDRGSATVTVDAAMSVASPIGHPGIPPGLAGDALWAHVTQLASAVLRA